MANASIGKAIDEVARLQIERDKLEVKTKVLDKKISALKDKLLARVKKSELGGAVGKLGRARIDEPEHPTIKDFNKLCAFVKKTNAWDLFQKRIAKQAWAARRDDGVVVPGVEVFKETRLVVTLVKKT